MPYKFKRQLSSLKTGMTYVVGSIVPDIFSSEPSVISAMVASGDVELVRVPIPEPIEEPIEELLKELLVEDAPAPVAKKSKKVK
jgi:hypothetical protein